LVLCAEHELNASAFAARVAASAGADLYACLSAALSTLSGSAHGGLCERVEALIASIGEPARATRTVRDWLGRGEPVPGFGHPLYAKGDPRGAYLIELARAQGSKSAAACTAFALLDAMAKGGHPAPTLDAGLVTLCHCLGLPRGSAASIFALGRSAGWVAHALEQRAAGYLLRPRAHYVGVAPRA
jgi:citrate synthase